MDQKKIRNFCIIAHIDHGKSTLADRFLEVTGTIQKREMKEQLLDTMDLERERGITIKLQPVRMLWTPKHEARNTKHEILNKSKIKNPNDEKGSLEFRDSDLGFANSEQYVLNLIDTPGHVDFSYEVSRSLAAVEGAILLVDASQGIEAQTLSNVYMAIEHDLEIIPVINKVDLPHAEPEKVAREIEEVLGVKRDEIIFASGKTGEGVEEILNRVVEKVPSPKGDINAPSTALIFDSFFDPYRGVITYVRVFDGNFKKGDKLQMIVAKTNAEAIEIGHLSPSLISEKTLETGQIGYIVTGLKEVSQARVGDTVAQFGEMSAKALPGYKKVTPFVFAGIFTTSGEDYPILKEALEKLSLSDSALVYEPESSQALGFGFRCGFLGLLHLEIVKERLEREFDLDLIVTSPSVTYRVIRTNNEEIEIHNPAELPSMTEVKELREPWLRIEIITPKDYTGGIMKLVQEKRGLQTGMSYIEEDRLILTYEIPMASVVTDFYDSLKSISSGYASLSYEILDYRASDLVKVDILVSGNKVDALSVIVHKEESYKTGLAVVNKLKESIPKQQFKVTLQAAIGGKFIAREDISALRKDVTAKLYGGDVTRKNKLLEKQKKGKKKMKAIGNVEIPTQAFLDLLKK